MKATAMILAIVVASGFFLELAGQIIYRCMAGEWLAQTRNLMDCREYTPYGLYRARPNTWEYLGPDYPCRTYTIDEMGCIPTGARHNAPVVVILGGSTSAGWGQSSHLESIPAQVQRLVGDRYRIINLARPGYTAWMELGALIDPAIAGMNPIMVIAIDGRNDWYYSDDPVLRATKRIHNPPRKWTGYSVLYSLSDRILGAPDVVSPKPNSDSAGAYVRMLLALGAYSESMGAKFIGVLQPGRELGYSEWSGSVAERITGKTWFVNGSGWLIDARQYWDVCHYTDDGARIIAQEIARLL